MRLKVPPAIFSRAEEPVAFDQPAVVVGLPECEQRCRNSSMVSKVRTQSRFSFMLPYALADRLQGLEAGGPCMCVNVDAFGGTMNDRDEYRGLAFAGKCRRQVGAPHRIEFVRDDGAVVVARSPRRTGPRRGKQAVLSH
jgi:hypothetical protein